MSEKKFSSLTIYGRESMGPIFKTDTLLYQSTANLDVKIFMVRFLIIKGFVQVCKTKSLHLHMAEKSKNSP